MLLDNSLLFSRISVIKENSLKFLDFRDAKHSVELIIFILSKYESFWKFNESAVTVNHMENLLEQILNVEK